jgi:hypothetical protein
LPSNISEENNDERVLDLTFLTRLRDFGMGDK